MVVLSPQLTEMVHSAPPSGVVLDLIVAAELTKPVVIDAETAAEAVSPYTWLLNRIGTDGIALTSAGRLPPAVVEETVAALGLNPYDIGKANRELRTPVVYLRESVQRLGLARRYKGRLVLSPAGGSIHGDPMALWWHFARHLPEEKPRSSVTQG